MFHCLRTLPPELHPVGIYYWGTDRENPEICFNWYQNTPLKRSCHAISFQQNTTFAASFDSTQVGLGRDDWMPVQLHLNLYSLEWGLPH